MSSAAKGPTWLVSVVHIVLDYQSCHDGHLYEEYYGM